MASSCTLVRAEAPNVMPALIPCTASIAVLLMDMHAITGAGQPSLLGSKTWSHSLGSLRFQMPAIIGWETWNYFLVRRPNGRSTLPA